MTLSAWIQQLVVILKFKSHSNDLFFSVLLKDFLACIVLLSTHVFESACVASASRCLSHACLCLLKSALHLSCGSVSVTFASR